MLVGLAKEVKVAEYRVALTPSHAKDLIMRGVQLIVEKGAGVGSGYQDYDYANIGCKIVDRETLFQRADIVVKVKEPQESEYHLLRPNQIIFAYLHLAPNIGLTNALIDSGAICIAFEMVTNDRGDLPLLQPMSEIAGRLAIQQGSYFLTKIHGGSGVLLGGMPGVKKGKVLIIGAGVVGTNAAIMALGAKANVVVVDTNMMKLSQLDMLTGSMLSTVYSTQQDIESHIVDSDIVVGAVLLPGASAPKIISKNMVKMMKSGSVLVDVAIDQGGCCENSVPTTHNDPIFIVDNVVHYCVANMPGAVPKTASMALGSAVLPYLSLLAKNGADAFKQNKHIRNGISVYRGSLVCKNTALSQDRPHVLIDTVL